MKKICFCVMGELNGKTFSKPGFASRHEAFTYADLKGWTDIVVRCEGSIEG